MLPHLHTSCTNARFSLFLSEIYSARCKFFISILRESALSHACMRAGFCPRFSDASSTNVHVKFKVKDKRECYANRVFKLSVDSKKSAKNLSNLERVESFSVALGVRINFLLSNRAQNFFVKVQARFRLIQLIAVGTL